MPKNLKTYQEAPHEVKNIAVQNLVLAQKYKQDIATERMDPNILDAFKSNPYTHSLSSTN